MIFGWIAFTWVNGAEPVPTVDSVFNTPSIFAWGLPALNSGMIVTAFLVAFILILNLTASVSAMQLVTGDKEESGRKRTRLERGGIMVGFSNIFTSVLSAIGMVPLSVSAGFVQLTGQRSKIPYFIACSAMIVVSFVPGLYSSLSLLPAQIAYAALFGSFYQMIGIGMVSILKVPLTERRLTIVGLSLTVGTGLMFLPQSLFTAMPTVFQYLLSNGVMVGMLAALLLENAWRDKESETVLFGTET